MRPTEKAGNIFDKVAILRVAFSRIKCACSYCWHTSSSWKPRWAQGLNSSSTTPAFRDGWTKMATCLCVVVLYRIECRENMVQMCQSIILGSISFQAFLILRNGRQWTFVNPTEDFCIGWTLVSLFSKDLKRKSSKKFQKPVKRRDFLVNLQSRIRVWAILTKLSLAWFFSVSF